MAEENVVDIIQTTPVAVPEGNRSQERITELSGKVETIAKERDTATAKADEADRRAAFAEGFADIVATQPNAKDHKDEIKEKVFKGYSVQDATYAVLGAAGKLGGASAPIPQVAGGSATTTMPQGGVKEVKDMSQAERREQLSKDLGWQ